MQGVFEFCRKQPRRPPRPERLFFGILPDEATADRIGGLAERIVREGGLWGKMLARERFHISLHSAGDHKRLASALLYAAKLAGDAVSMQPFEARFTSIKSFERRRSADGPPAEHPLVMICEGEGLFALHQTLGACLKACGLKAALRFTPHVTVFYGQDPIPFRPVEPIHFVVRGFALIHSKLGLGEYEILERWRLAAATTPPPDGSYIEDVGENA